MSKLDALEDELDAAAAAFKEHVNSGIVVRYGDSRPSPAQTTITPEWMDTYSELRELRNDADAALIHYLTGGSRSA